MFFEIGHQKQIGYDCTRIVTQKCHLGRIAVKVDNLSLNPSQGKDHVLNANVARQKLIVVAEKALNGWKAEKGMEKNYKLVF